MFQNNQYERAVDILDDAMLIARRKRQIGMAGINSVMELFMQDGLSIIML